MIITKQKDFDELLGMMDGQDSVFIVGCGECATTCRTGGEKEVAEMSSKLTEKRKTVTGTAVINAPCLELDTRRVLRQNKVAVDKTEAILVLACGAGVQAVAEAVNCSVYPGCDSLFLGNVFRHQHFYEKCSTCGGVCYRKLRRYLPCYEVFKESAERAMRRQCKGDVRSG